MLSVKCFWNPVLDTIDSSIFILDSLLHHQHFHVHTLHECPQNFVSWNNYSTNSVESILDRCFQSKTRMSTTTTTKIDWDKNRSRLSHSCMYLIEKCIQISRDVHVKNNIIWSLNGIAVFGVWFKIPGRLCRFASMRKKMFINFTNTCWCSCPYI